MKEKGVIQGVLKWDETQKQKQQKKQNKGDGSYSERWEINHFVEHIS